MVIPKTIRQDLHLDQNTLLEFKVSRGVIGGDSLHADKVDHALRSIAAKDQLVLCSIC